jgi:hypothetical protein
VNVEEIEKAAQAAAEQRLYEASEFLNEENDGSTLAALFCGCETCVIREVLEAAWPYLYRLAHHPDTQVPDL